MLISAVLSLVACTTPSQRQLEEITVGTEQLWARYGACMREVEATAAYQRLEGAYIFRMDDPHAVEKMAIDRLANNQEKADLVQNQKNTSRCNQRLFKGFAKNNPDFNVLLARFMSEDKELVAQTIQDEVKVGARNLIVQQRFAQRLRDWTFSGERLVRLYSWRSRRNCSVYSCSGSYLASLLPTSWERAAYEARAIAPPPRNGQTAARQRLELPAERPTPKVAPTPPAMPEVKTTTGPVSLGAVTNAEAPTPKAAPTPSAASAVKKKTEPVAQESARSAEPPGLKVIPIPPAVPDAKKKTGSVAQGAATAAPSPPAASDTKSPTGSVAVTQGAVKTAEPPAAKATPSPPAASDAKTTTGSGAQGAETTSRSSEPPLQGVDIGLAAAAGPAAEPAAPAGRLVEASHTPSEVQPRYTVHLASMRSEVEARATWGQLQARYPAILADRVFFTRAIKTKDKGAFVRVLTGLFSDRQQAKDLCRQLGSGDQYCAVIGLPEGDG